MLTIITNIVTTAWAAFKTASGLSSIKKPKEVLSSGSTTTKDKPDPHICLKCGGELSRGRDFNKKRHWLQKHKDEPQHDYEQQIVPKNHELVNFSSGRTKIEREVQDR
jgi:hypothetical protein